MKKLFLAALMMSLALAVNAQSGMNSPYSQWGLGLLSDQTSGFNAGMNGVGLGFHEHNQVNYINPASYSSVDSLTFLFDAGISGQISNFNENGVKKNAKNANLDYVVAAFRAFRHMGVSFGILPFSNVGYNYSVSGWVNEETKEDYYTNTYEGDEGFHQAYLGLGYMPVKGLSVGANISYLWGKYNRTVTNSYSNSYINSLSRNYSARVGSYKLDFGVQYTQRVSKKDWVTLGLTYSPKHNLGASADMYQVKTNAMDGSLDTTSFSIDKAFELPHMVGAGLMWNHAAQWKVGLDYTLQMWEDLKAPVFDGRNYVLKDGCYSNRHKINLGAQYCYGEYSRRFLQRVQYRAGVSYTTPYVKINGQDGPKEFAVSAGFGIPIVNSYNSRSFLNISGQWVKRSAKDFIKENIFRINIGFTFNEDWFKKWKMQ